MSGYGNPNGGRANSGRNSGAREPAFSGSVDRIGYIGIIEEAPAANNRRSQGQSNQGYATGARQASVAGGSTSTGRNNEYYSNNAGGSQQGYGGGARQSNNNSSGYSSHSNNYYGSGPSQSQQSRSTGNSNQNNQGTVSDYEFLKAWGGKRNFMESYGLKIHDPEDHDVARDLIDRMRDEEGLGRSPYRRN